MSPAYVSSCFITSSSVGSELCLKKSAKSILKLVCLLPVVKSDNGSRAFSLLYYFRVK